MPTPIEDYALIGDCETAALVSRNGSIDWLCWPTFASPACFAALLGTDDNGRWSIAPKLASRSSRRYLDHTLVLETTFETETGAAVLTDFMPLRKHTSNMIRIVRGIRGRVDMHMELSLRFDYGRTVPWVTSMEDGALRAIAGPDMVVLRTQAPLRGEGLKTVSDFTIAEGESLAFVLRYAPSYDKLPHPVDPQQALQDTIAFWQDWTSRAHLHGEYAGELERSLITLKALTYRHTGGMVAAPTTSLPECIGGERNWDYRYCWLRDATFTLLALMNAGYTEEAFAWRDWLLRAVAGSPDQVQIMYGIRGERQLLEWEIPWLGGYENSKPVRIGNAASEQLQLDCYGEVNDAMFQAHLAGMPPTQDDVDLHHRVERAPGDDLGSARSGHLGGARRPPAFHLFQSYGVGGVSIARSRPRRHFVRTSMSSAGANCAITFTPMSARKATTRASAASPRRTVPINSTPRCY